MMDFLQLLAAGLSLGAIYALVTLSFVVVYKATGILNFATGGSVLLGAYITYAAAVTWGLPFFVALIVSMICMAALGALTERIVLRKMIGQPVFAIIMVTLGALTVIVNTSSAIWGQDLLAQANHLGSYMISFCGFQLKHYHTLIFAFATVALVVFFLFFRYSRLGLAMRATTLDAEAALAQGIRVRHVFMIAWAMAGAMAALAGVMLSAGPRGISIEVAAIALRAFPAMILGGLESPSGAVVGGGVIGVTEVFTAALESDYQGWVGSNFHVVMPYIVMIVILVVRPYGLFGSKRAERV